MGKNNMLLKDNLEPEFGVLAIACHEPDYRACWLINQALNVTLIRVDDMFPADEAEKPETGFSRFHFRHPGGDYELDLLSNYSANRILLPAHKNVDFFLKISGEERSKYVHEMVAKLKKAENILTVFEITPKDRRSFQVFIF